MPQRERADNRPSFQPRERTDSRPSSPTAPRADNRSTFHQRDHSDGRPGFAQPPRTNDLRVLQSPERIQPPRPAMREADRTGDHRGNESRPFHAPDTFRRAPATHVAPPFEHRAAIERHAWHGRTFDHDRHHWHEGHWVHAHHGGHVGWWWVIGPVWYLYPTPVYPYPDPDAPIVVYDEPETADLCTEFHGDAIVNDTGEPFFGTACLQPDGQWHIVSG